MFLPELEEYTDSEYFRLLNRYELLPAHKKDFNELIGIRITRKDFEQFKNLNVCSPQTMAFACNYFQNQDQVKETYGKRLFFALLDIDLSKKDKFQYYFENLIEKQFNKNETIYLILMVHREAELEGKKVKTIWQMPIFRVPDKVTPVYFNRLKHYEQELEEQQWYQITRAIDGVFHVDVYQFKNFYNWYYKDYSTKADGGLEIMWYLYKFLNFVEPEKVEKIEYDRKQFHRQIQWLMLRLRFNQEELPDEDPYFQEMPIDYKQKHRHFNPNKNIIKIKTYSQSGMQTEFSVHPRLNFDFGRFGQNPYIYIEKDKQDQETQTQGTGIGFEFNQQQEYTKVPRDIGLQMLQEDFSKRKKYVPNNRANNVNKFQYGMTDKNKEVYKKQQKNNQNFSLDQHVNQEYYRDKQEYFDNKEYMKKAQNQEIPQQLSNMASYCKFLLEVDKDLKYQEQDQHKKTFFQPQDSEYSFQKEQGGLKMTRHNTNANSSFNFSQYY